MFCRNCGNKLEENIKFCVNCGEKLIKSVDQSLNEEKNTTKEEGEILYIISEINNPSMTFSGANGHWLILFTKEAVFFVKTGWSSWYQGNPGRVFGLVGSLAVLLIKNTILNKDNKNKIPSLSSILSEAKKYYKFEANKLNQIRVKKTWRNKIIFLDGVESSTLEILVEGEQYNDFISQTKILFGYDLIENSDK